MAFVTSGAECALNHLERIGSLTSETESRGDTGGGLAQSDIRGGVAK